MAVSQEKQQEIQSNYQVLVSQPCTSLFALYANVRVVYKCVESMQQQQYEFHIVFIITLLGALKKYFFKKWSNPISFLDLFHVFFKYVCFFSNLFLVTPIVLDFGFWLLGFSKIYIFLFFLNENCLGFDMRYRLFNSALQMVSSKS